MSARLGSADARLGLLRLGDAVGAGGGGGAGGFVDRSWANESAPDALVARMAFARRDRAWLVAQGCRGDVERPDAIDQLPVTKSPWDVALSQPVPVPAGRQSRWRTWGWWAFGEPPRVEPITADKWLQEVRLPARIPPRVVTDWYAADDSHLGDAEDVKAPAFAVTLDRVRPGRPEPLHPADADMLTAELIPEDPVAQLAPWHVGFTARPHPRRPTHTLPGGAWAPSEAFAPESPQADKFVVPFGRVVARRPQLADPHMAGLDEPDDFRAETVRTEAFGPLSLPSRRPPATQLPGALVILPELAFETPHADAIQSDVQPPGLLIRRPSAGIYETARTEVIISQNFGQPNLAILHKYQLSGGLWRARL